MAVGRVIDLSSNNHPNTTPITWPAVAHVGVTTAIIKATEGTGYINPWYGRDMTGARAEGLDVLAYHFAGFGTVSREAAFFQSVAGLAYARVLDAETSTDVAWINLFLQTLGLPRTSVMDYGSGSSLSQIGSQVRGMLWVAEYPSSGAPVIGYPGYGVLWQFTDQASIPGITGWVDESKWYGTETQYDILFNKTAPPPQPVPPLEVDMQTTDPVSGTVVATDAQGNLYARPGALPAVPTLSQHPTFHAGTPANPCVGIVFEKTATAGTWGVTFVTQPVGSPGSFGPYNLYHFDRGGQPH